MKAEAAWAGQAQQEGCTRTRLQRLQRRTRQIAGEPAGQRKGSARGEGMVEGGGRGQGAASGQIKAGPTCSLPQSNWMRRRSGKKSWVRMRGVCSRAARS